MIDAIEGKSYLWCSTNNLWRSIDGESIVRPNSAVVPSGSAPGCNADAPHLVHIVLGDQYPVRINLSGQEHKLTKAAGWELLELLDGMISMLGE